MSSRTLGGILLVAGTTIGAGMLALPVLTAQSGFFYSSLLMVGYWQISIYAALLLLEVNLWFKGEVNMISMAKATLGKKGEIFAWIVYLLLLYALTAAYLAGGGQLVAEAYYAITGGHLPSWFEPLPLLLCFGIFVCMNTKVVDQINRVLMVGLVVSYLLLLSIVTGHVNHSLIQSGAAYYVWVALPVVATSFGFQIIIPSLVVYLERDLRSLKKVIFIGSAIPLIVYVLWQYAILGTVAAEGSPSLMEALRAGASSIDPLIRLLNKPHISIVANFFSIFAILTSFIGVGLSLADFLSDGLMLKKEGFGKLWIGLLTFLPPLAFVWLYPKGFILALQYAGVCVALLLGILPALMTWRGRMLFGQTAAYRVKGGVTGLLLTILFFCCVVVAATANPL